MDESLGGSREPRLEHPALRRVFGTDLGWVLGDSTGHDSDSRAELEGARAALAETRSEKTLRNYLWTAQRAGAVHESFAAVAALEELYGSGPPGEQPEFLAKLRSSPLYLLSLLDSVPRRPRSRLVPTPRTLCYVLTHTLPYSSNGYATRSQGVALGVKAAGWDVFVLSRPGYPLDLKPELTAGDVPLYDSLDGVQFVRTLSPLRASDLAPTGLPRLEYLLRAADAIEETIAACRPSVVMAASNHETALPALIASRRLGLPFIYEVRGLWEITRVSRQEEFAANPFFHVQRVLEAGIGRLADHVFAITEPLREELAKRSVPLDKIDLLPNSADVERFQPLGRDEDLARRLGLPRGVPVIGYVGSFVDYEGLEDLAAACAVLKREGVAFRLLLVGSEVPYGDGRGDIMAHIEELAAGGSYADWLIMPGRVPHDEVEAYYSLIDIAPFPRKPWPVCEMVSPMKTLEALAMEKAVIVSSVRALTEQIRHEETGLVFEKGSIDDLAATLSRAASSPDLRASLGRAGREWVRKERTWNRVGSCVSSVANVLERCFSPVAETSITNGMASVSAPVRGDAVRRVP